MNTCAVQDVAALQPADHICIWDTSRWPFRYTHHGVVYTAGPTADAIVVAHVWSRVAGFRASQQDSRFMLTTLREFLSARPLRDMRRVQYNSSLLADALSRLGEVHRARADAPPVVLARCRFLLGLGQGHFSILSLNCEHVALWCTTGVGWSKQLLSRAGTGVPFVRSPSAPSTKSAHLLQRLEQTLEDLRGQARLANAQLLQLRGRRVYLRQRVAAETPQGKRSARYAKRFGDALYLVANDPHETDWAFRQQPTALRLRVQVSAYNCVQVAFEDYADPTLALCASPSALKLTKRRALQPKRGFQFELGWHGELQSLRLRRWFVGAQTRDGRLRPFSSRDKAAAFDIVDAEEADAAFRTAPEAEGAVA
ncbi:hypothetical protein BBJ28_00013806 [Nothophytophthora sp. Chile5]|nr:hypothetical protein BBJ28_00013806 [Nothophytophthora sp. Chile5]